MKSWKRTKTLKNKQIIKRAAQKSAARFMSLKEPRRHSRWKKGKREIQVREQTFLALTLCEHCDIFLWTLF